MSRRPRQSKPSKGRSAKGRSADSKPAAEPAVEEAKNLKAKLPAFGFAEDLLNKSKAEEKADASPVEPRQTGSRQTGSRQTGLRGADPERIFTFADSLEAKASDDEPVADPVCITTWVTFDLGQEIFALPVEPVREVLRVASITRVPHAPHPIRGVTNLRGRVIPVIDLRIRIGLDPKELDRTSRVIVVGARSRLLGLLVDAVHQVLYIDLNQAQSPPDDVMTVQSDYITGVYHHGDRLILLLDVDRALVVQDSATPGDLTPPPGAGPPGSGRPGAGPPGSGLEETGEGPSEVIS